MKAYIKKGFDNAVRRGIRYVFAFYPAYTDYLNAGWGLDNGLAN